MDTMGSFKTLAPEEVEVSSLTWRDHGPLLGGDALSAYTQLKAHKELGETEQRKASAVENLREMLQNHAEANGDATASLMRTFRDAPDRELIKFLRARKFNETRAFDLMMGYVKYRANYPELFNKINVETLKLRVANGQPGVLPHRDNEGRVVLFFRMENWDPEDYPFSEAIQTLLHVLERLLVSEETQVNGLCLVEDFEGYTMNHVAAVGLSDYKKMIDMLQGSFPCRFKGVHCIKQPWFFSKTYSLIKPLLKAKLFQRIYLYGDDLSEFYNHFPKEYLPKDLGGTGPIYNGKVAAENIFGPTDTNEELTAF